MTFLRARPQGLARDSARRWSVGAEAGEGDWRWIMPKYTARVRRGFADLVNAGLLRGIDSRIAHMTRPGLTRKERFSASEVADLVAARAWIEQEAAREVCSESESAPTPALAA